MPVTLDQILTATRGRLPDLRARRAAVEREAAAAIRPPSLAAALRRGSVAVIAEVKRRSPSAGSIREDLDPAERAERYARHGAAAISVLTDGPFFGGSLDDLRAAVGRTAVPVLRKDFILDELQIVEARAAGAAAVLLIVRALSAPGSASCCLRERRRPRGTRRGAYARRAGARARRRGHHPGREQPRPGHLRGRHPSAWTMLRVVPRRFVAVAESGMASVADVEAAAAAGADAVLIGTALSSAVEPDDLLGRLSAVTRRGR